MTLLIQYIISSFTNDDKNTCHWISRVTSSSYIRRQYISYLISSFQPWFENKSLICHPSFISKTTCQIDILPYVQQVHHLTFACDLHFIQKF